MKKTNSRLAEVYSDMTCSVKNDDDSPGEIFNRSSLLARIGGNAEMIPRFIDLFLESAEDCLSKLEQAVSADDLVTARKVAHTLKGVSGNIGADRMHGVALKMGERVSHGDREGIQSVLAELRDEYVLFKTTTCAIP
jgi:HPt (histidine-containing phosphotransfer) domain-containing protein